MTSSAPKIKFCGITQADDFKYALSLNADYIGFNLYHASKRYIDAQHLRILLNGCKTQIQSANTQLVAIFVDPAHAELKSFIQAFPEIKIIQLHGQESVATMAQFQQAFPDIKFWKAVGIRDADDIAKAATYTSADLVLLDSKAPTHDPTNIGGRGEAFNWQLLQGLKFKTPLGIAGGINLENFAAVLKLQPALIDICSGIEVSPGIKNHKVMQNLMSLKANT